MSHEVLITRRQSIFIYFFANPGRGEPQKAGAGWCWLVLDVEVSSSLDLQKKCFVFWLSGPHGTSNFDHQSLIHSDLNYTNGYISASLTLQHRDVEALGYFGTSIFWHKDVLAHVHLGTVQSNVDNIHFGKMFQCCNILLPKRP